MPSRRSLKILYPGLTIVVALTASCGDRASTAPAKTPQPIDVTLSAEGCGVNGPTKVAADAFTVRFANETSAEGRLDVWLLDDGHAYGEFERHIADEQKRWKNGEPPLGHPDFATLVTTIATPSGSTRLEEVSADDGTYGFACIPLDDDAREPLWSAGPVIVDG